MTAILIIFLNIFLPLLLIVCARRYSLSLWLSPLLFICIQLVIGVSIKGTLLMIQPDAESRLDFGYEKTLLLDAYFYLFLFIGFLLLGYIRPGQVVCRRASYEAVLDTPLNSKYLSRLLVTCVVVSLVTLVLLSYQKDGLGSLSSLFRLETFQYLQKNRVNFIEDVDGYGNTFSATSIFFSINTLAFCIILVQKFWFVHGQQTKAMQKSLNIGLLVVSMLVLMEALIIGSRNQVAGYVLIYMAIVFSGPKGMTTRQIVRLGFVLLLVMSVVSFMTNYRYGSAGQGSSGFFDTLYDSLLQPIFYSEYFLSITKLTVIISQVTSESVLMGKSLVSWVVGLIPRPLWPDKPAISLGLYVKSEIYGLRGTIGGIPPTFPGELFINFSWFGLLLAPVYGYALRMFEIYCFKPLNIRTHSTHWVYFLLITPITYNLMQNALGAVLVTGIAQCLIAVAVIYATRGARRVPHRRMRRSVRQLLR